MPPKSIIRLAGVPVVDERCRGVHVGAAIREAIPVRFVFLFGGPASVLRQDEQRRVGVPWKSGDRSPVEWRVIQGNPRLLARPVHGERRGDVQRKR